MQPQDWTPYFEYLASSAAALLGLAFVALQVSHRRLIRNPIYRSEARTSLTELAAALFFALIYLMPAHAWFWAGAVAGAMGFMALVWHGVDYRAYLRKNQKDSASEKSIHRFQWWLTLGVFIVTFGGLQIPVDELRGALVLWLVFSGLAETWWMLFGHNQHPHVLTSGAPYAEAHYGKPIIRAQTSGK
jgi:hypothetical protein